MPPEPPSTSKFRQEPPPDRNRTYDKETRWPTKDKNYYLMTKRKVNQENKLKVSQAQSAHIHICLFIQHVHCQGKFENKSPVAVGPLPKAHYALEAYSNETWKMVMALSSL